MEHRIKNPVASHVIYPCFVARKVPRSEASWNPLVKQAMKEEKENILMQPGPSALSAIPQGKARELGMSNRLLVAGSLSRNNRRNSKIIHLGRVHCMCFERVRVGQSR